MSSRLSLVPFAAMLLMLAAASASGEDRGFDPARPESWRIRDPDFYSITARGQRIWAVGYWGAVVRSEDGGDSWAAVDTPTHATLFDVSFGDDRHGWTVGENGLVLRSTDGGASWVRQPVTLQNEFDEPRPLDVHLLGVSAVSATEAWAVGDWGVVLHVRDGQTWETVRIPEEAFGDDEVPDRIFNAVDFPDSQHGWIVGEFGTTLRTRDGGQSWVGERSLQRTPEDLYLFDVSALDGEHAAVVGLAGNVLVTRDGGATWAPRRAASSVALYGISWSQRRATAVGDRGELFTSEDQGLRWVAPQRPVFFNWLRSVVHAGEDRVYAAGEKGLILRSDDGGDSWTRLLGREPPPLAAVSVPEPKHPTKPDARQPRAPLLPPTAER